MSEMDNEINQKPDVDGLSASGVRRVLTPGTMLRQKRESENLELSTIARELNLDPWMLTALENDNYSKFSAQVFAKGHLKHYAQHLGLDHEDVLFAYYQVAERKETTPVIKDPLILSASSNPHAALSKWFMWLLALLAIAALVYAIYVGSKWWLQDAKLSVIPATEQALANTETTEANSEVLSAGLSESSAADPGQTESDLDPSSLSPEPEQTQNIIDAPITSEQTVAGLSAEPVSRSSLTTLDQVSSNVNADTNILRFNFVENSWVEVIDENDQRLIYGMADQGTVREISLIGLTNVFLGNVEGAEMTLNGSPFTVPPGAKAGRTARFVLEPAL